MLQFLIDSFHFDIYLFAFRRPQGILPYKEDEDLNVTCLHVKMATQCAHHCIFVAMTIYY